MKRLIVVIALATVLLSSCQFINGTQYDGFYDNPESETDKTYTDYMFVEVIK